MGVYEYTPTSMSLACENIRFSSLFVARDVFCGRTEVPEVPPREMSPAAKSEEKRMFSQATMGYEGNNRGKKEAPTRKGQEHTTRKTKTTKVNSIMWLHIQS